MFSFVIWCVGIYIMFYIAVACLHVIGSLIGWIVEEFQAMFPPKDHYVARQPRRGLTRDENSKALAEEDLRWLEQKFERLNK